MYPKTIEENIINHFDPKELNAFLVEIASKYIIETDSQHHKVATYLNEIVAAYGKDRYSYEYKALLSGLTDEKIIGYVQAFVRPAKAKKFNINKETFDILRQIAWIKIIFEESTAFKWFGNCSALKEKDVSLINNNFEKLKVVFDLMIASNDAVEINALFKAAFIAKVTATPESFSQYCNEIEVISCILERPIYNIVFLNMVDLKDKVILYIAPKYGYYPECKYHECNRQLSYRNLQPETLNHELKNEFNLSILSDIINCKSTKELHNHLKHPATFKLETALLDANVESLIDVVIHYALLNEDNEILKLLKKTLAQPIYSKTDMYFINKMTNNKKSPECNREIIKNLSKINTKEVFRLINYQIYPNSYNIMHLLLAQQQPIAENVRFEIYPDYYYNSYEKAEAEVMMKNAWSQLSKEVQFQTLSTAVILLINQYLPNNLIDLPNIKKNGLTMSIESTQEFTDFIVNIIKSTKDFTMPFLSKLIDLKTIREQGVEPEFIELIEVVKSHEMNILQEEINGINR